MTTQWATGITTSPRNPSTFGRTMRSLERAGFYPHIFKDYGMSIDTVFLKNGVTERPRPFGAWKNWLSGLNELRASMPSASFYAMFQDDVVFCQNIKQYLNQSLWPSDKAAVASIFTPYQYSGRERGWKSISLGESLWMAQAYIFNPKYIDEFLTDTDILKWDGDKNIDTNVGKWIEKKELEIYYHVPSLCQHFIINSTLWPNMPAIGLRAAGDFVGEVYDATSLCSTGV